MFNSLEQTELGVCLLKKKKKKTCYNAIQFNSSSRCQVKLDLNTPIFLTNLQRKISKLLSVKLACLLTPLAMAMKSPLYPYFLL